jgi:hypothetical protein
MLIVINPLLVKYTRLLTVWWNLVECRHSDQLASYNHSRTYIR